jgi:hypothetical protein
VAGDEEAFYHNATKGTTHHKAFLTAKVTKGAKNDNRFNAEGAEKAETKTLNHRFSQIHAD